MILEEYCEVSLFTKNREYYKNKGYDITKNKIIIKIEDLNPGSHKKVRVSCDICNKEKFLEWREYLLSYNNGNYYSCSSLCAQGKNKLTNIERYGVDNPSKSQDILLKKGDNNLKKYGVRSPLELESIKERIKKTCIERYGVDNPTKSKEIYSKVRKTIEDRFGNEIMFKTDHFRGNKKNYQSFENEKFLNLRKSELLDIGISLVGIDDFGDYIINCDKGHSYITRNDVLQKRLNLYKTDPCTICNKINSGSFVEDELFNFISEIYKGDIIKNSRKVIDPYEIDIYLPEKKLAFEFNGIFWHNEKFKSDYYHKMKYDLCVKKNIQLIQIWEDDWKYRNEIVRSIILNKIGSIKSKIYARNTKIVVFDNNKETKKFLNDNHLQGDCKSNIKIGLIHNNDLVSLMTFSKNRYGVGKIKNDEYELVRFCNKINTNVVGGASKILKYFKNNYKFNTLISFSDCDISNGSLYEKLGFNFVYDIKPTYYYIINGKRDHRFKWRKSNLIKKNLLLEKETEKECMLRLGYNRIYNSGHKKWIIK